jgi:hypothetical protein
MEINKTKVVHMAMAAVAICLLATSSLAASLVVAEGQLIGATGVDVDGTLYDVQFLDGFYSDTFQDESDLDTTSEAQARLFGQALMDQVFVDSAEGLFDSDPELTFGCGNLNACFVWIPFDIDFDTFEVTAVLAINRRPEATQPEGVRDSVGGNGYLNNFADDTTWVYADWQVVPVPAAAWLFVSALGLLGWMRRKVR